MVKNHFGLLFNSTMPTIINRAACPSYTHWYGV